MRQKKAPIVLTASEFFSGQSVLVTGGAGFIGSHLTESLVAGGAHVTVVDSPRAHHPADLKNCSGRIAYVVDDILADTFGALLAAETFDSIFHLAGNAYVPSSIDDPWRDFQANAVGTLKLLDSLRRSRRLTRLIVFSSAAVYGNIDSVSIREDDPTVPISPYGVSKLAADRYVAVYASLYGVRAATVRPFSAYGPRQRKQVVYDFIRKLASGSSEIVAFGNGTQVRDFNYVTDIVQAALCVAENGPLRGEAYNVGSGEACSTQHLLNLLCELMKVRPQICWSGASRPGDPFHFLANIDRLRMLGWRPTVSFREGLQRTLDWYQTDRDFTGNGGF